jgi:D-glucosaminate-6-phosphate ammonia-lyase
MTGHDWAQMEQLPRTDGLARTAMAMQRGHRYKYTRCALMSGARLREAGGENGTTEQDLLAALDSDVACVLHPAHLDGVANTLDLEAVVRLAHGRRIPVVVDAAYMSYPPTQIRQYGDAGADLVCLSAKYFWGPNAGGFVYGRTDLVQTVAELDFTRFESGNHLIFGRAFKMDRLNVVATVLALREWLEMDHAARWEAYRKRADGIIAALSGLPARLRPGCFTLDERIVDEPVNAVLIEPTAASGITAAVLEARLASGSPRLISVTVGNVLALCLETFDNDEELIVIRRVTDALSAAAPGLRRS